MDARTGGRPMRPLLRPYSRPANASECRSRLLPDDFVVAPPCAFAHHPARRNLERPSISGNGHVVAPDGRRHTARAAITRDEHALLRFERAPASRCTEGAEVHRPDTRNHNRAPGI